MKPHTDLDLWPTEVKTATYKKASYAFIQQEVRFVYLRVQYFSGHSQASRFTSIRAA